MSRLAQYFILVCGFIGCVIFAFLTCKLLIKYQLKKKISQPIHELGVKKHQKKSGTPLFGGVSFYIAPLIFIMIFSPSLFNSERKMGYLIGISLYFFVGLIDDLIKAIFKNEKGLSAKIRVALEILFALVSLFIMGYDEKFSWTMSLYPFNTQVFLNYLYIFLCVFLILGTSNSCNLLDGLDGLSSGTTLIALATVMVFAFLQNEVFLGTYLLFLCGGILGFLILNSHPAKIFMGDCGSLFLGASLAFSVIYLDKLTLLPFVGFLYAVESISVIIQVIYFKITHKRVFLMAPLHHHFELKKVPEYKITMSYYLIQTSIMIVLLLMRTMI